MRKQFLQNQITDDQSIKLFIEKYQENILREKTSSNKIQIGEMLLDIQKIKTPGEILELDDVAWQYSNVDDYKESEIIRIYSNYKLSPKIGDTIFIWGTENRDKPIKGIITIVDEATLLQLKPISGERFIEKRTSQYPLRLFFISPTSETKKQYNYIIADVQIDY